MPVIIQWWYEQQSLQNRIVHLRVPLEEIFNLQNQKLLTSNKRIIPKYFTSYFTESCYTL